MRAKNVRNFGTALGCLAVILILVLAGGISWIVTCGIVKLITLCFELTFSWLWATGIWFILMLLSGALCECK
jgi:hypothetical protein